PRLLVLDGHSSHITGRFIVFYKEHSIELLILPPHTSHVLQPLDISCFSPLKGAIARAVDQLQTYKTQPILKQQWIKIYSQARQKALNLENITSGFRSAGLWPVSQFEVEQRLGFNQTFTPSPINNLVNIDTLDKSLLDSSPPEATELHTANSVFLSVLNSLPSLKTSAKRYTKRVTRQLELRCSEAVIHKTEKQKLQLAIEDTKVRRKTKRVALEGKFIYTTDEVIEITQKAEAAKQRKQPRRNAKKQRIDPQIQEPIEEDLE
ncbi:DDE-domain-containing protein, partial [Polychaeton citri CBS 116435]